MGILRVAVVWLISVTCVRSIRCCDVQDTNWCAQKKGRGYENVKSRTKKTPRILKTVVFFVGVATQVCYGPATQEVEVCRDEHRSAATSTAVE